MHMHVYLLSLKHMYTHTHKYTHWRSNTVEFQLSNNQYYCKAAH